MFEVEIILRYKIKINYNFTLVKIEKIKIYLIFYKKN